jgi:hypothetical protein
MLLKNREAVKDRSRGAFSPKAPKIRLEKAQMAQKAGMRKRRREN